MLQEIAPLTGTDEIGTGGAGGAADTQVCGAGCLLGEVFISSPIEGGMRES